MSKIVPLRQNEKADPRAFKLKRCMKDQSNTKHVINTEHLKLLGPIAYYYYPNINGRSILLLGDEHTPTTQCTKCNNNDVCMDINEYLTRIIRQDLVPEKDRKCIDFFLEEAYHFSEKQGKDLEKQVYLEKKKKRSKKTKKVISGGGKKKKEYCSKSFDQSGKLEGVKGRFFDIDGKNIPCNITGVVCDKRLSKIKFEKNPNKKGKTECISRKKLGIPREEILYKLRNTYLQQFIKGGIPVSILPRLSPLQYIRDNFNICIKDRDFCAKAFPYLRYHYFDIRHFSGIDFDKEFSKLLALGKAYKDSHMMIPILSSYISGNLDTLKNLKKKLLETFKPLSFQKILQNLLLFCIGETTDNNVGEKIYDEMELHYKSTKDTNFMLSKRFIEIMSEKIQKQLNNLDESLNFNKQELIDFIVNMYRKKTEKSTGTYPFLIDIYLLARMFRKYDDKSKLKRGVSGCIIKRTNDNNVSKNIIVYAGDHHINTYKEFFSDVLGVKPTVEVSQNYLNKDGSPSFKKLKNVNKCINIPHIQPFGIPIFDKKYSWEYKQKKDYWK